MPRDRLKVIPGKGQKHLEKREKVFFLFLIFLLVFLLTQVGYSWLGPWVMAQRLKIFEAQTGIMENLTTVEGIVIRSEQVIKSPAEGILVERHSPGKRIAVGGKVAVLNQGGGDKSRYYITSPLAGLISYHIDGLEHLGPGQFPYQLLANGLPERVDEREIQQNTLIRKGDPLFKVVDNWGWYFSIVLRSGHPQSRPGSAVLLRETIRMSFSFYAREYVEARRVDFQRTPAGDVYLTYLIIDQLPGFENRRFTEAVLLLDTYEGVLVPVSALGESDGKTGVFVNNGGLVQFFPVKVIYSGDKKAVIDGVPPGYPVISRPDLVMEGQRLR